MCNRVCQKVTKVFKYGFIIIRFLVSLILCTRKQPIKKLFFFTFFLHTQVSVIIIFRVILRKYNPRFFFFQSFTTVFCFFNGVHKKTRTHNKIIIFYFF